MITKLALCLSLFLSLPAFAAQTAIKIATVAPAGTTWINELEKTKAKIEAETGGAVTMRIYAGGVLGDETDVVRKIRIGQVHAAAFTGMGMGELLSDIRVLDLPFLAKTDSEVDRLLAGLYGRFEKSFASKGFVLLGFVPVGFVYVLSDAPIRSLADLRKGKVWVWEGDPLARDLFKVGGISGIPLALPDVLTSLQTGLINTVYGTPLASIALQWNNKVKWRTDLPLAHATGGIVLKKAIFDGLTAEQQKILRGNFQDLSNRLAQAGRKENEEALQVMTKQGVQTATVDAKSRDEFLALAPQVADGEVGKLYSKELLAEARKIVKN